MTQNQKKAKKKGPLPQFNENQRIKAIRKMMALTQQQFASQIGISQAALSDIENEKNGISYDVFKRIIEAFHVKSEWLMYRNGEPFDPVNETLVVLNQQYNPPKRKKDGGPVAASGSSVDDVRQGPAGKRTDAALEGTSICYIGGKEATMSYATRYADWDYLQQQPGLRVPGLVQGEEYRAFEIRDENMFPTLNVGDIAVGRLMAPKATLEQGQVYLAVTAKGGIKLGRLTTEAEGTDLVLQGDNPNTPATRVQRKQLLQLWKIERVVTARVPARQQLDATLSHFGQSLEELRSQLARLKQ